MAFICPKEPGGDRALLMHGDKAQVQKKKKKRQIKYARLSVFRATKSFPTGTNNGSPSRKNKIKAVLLQKIQQSILKSDPVRVKRHFTTEMW